jgi:hypothetical protein
MLVTNCSKGVTLSVMYLIRTIRFDGTVLRTGI